MLHEKLLSRVPRSQRHHIRETVSNLLQKAQQSSVADQPDSEARHQYPSAESLESRSKNMLALLNVVQDKLAVNTQKAGVTSVQKVQRKAALQGSADYLDHLANALNIPHPDTDLMEKQGRSAMSFLQEGYAGKAFQVASRLLNNVTPPIDDDAVRRLREMNPPLNTDEPLPELPPGAPRVDISHEEVRATIMAVNKGASPDPHGWFGALAAMFLNRKKDLCALAAILTDIANGDLPNDVKNALLAGRLAPILKSFEEVAPGIFANIKYRPICSGTFLLKLVGLVLLRRVIIAAIALLSPIQRGVGVPSGCESAIHSVQLMLELNPLWIAAKTDFINAFNTTKRSLVLKAIFAQDSLKHLWRFVHMCYSVPSLLFLFVDGGLLTTMLSSEGLRQGDVLGSLLFCIGVRQFYADTIMKSGAQGVAICDDLTIVGPPEQVVIAFQHIVAHSKAQTGLEVSIPKCSVFLPRTNQVVPEYFVALKATHPAFSTQIGGVMPLVGSCIGLDDDARRDWVTAKVKETIPLLNNLLHPSISIQAAVIFLRTSVFAHLNYLLRSLPPAVTAPGAKIFRDAAINTLCDKLRIERTDVATDTVSKQLFLPAALGGLGFADPVAIAPAAYIASVVACSPLFVTTSFHNVSGEHASSADNIVTASMIPQLLATYDQSLRSSRPPSAKENPGMPLSLCLHHLQDALDSLTLKQVLPLSTSADLLVIPDNVRQLFECFPDGQPPGIKLQHTIAKQLHIKQHADLVSLLESSAFDSARLRAASEEASGLWCTTLPTSPGCELSDFAYRTALCLRLGLHPDKRIKESLQPVHCPNRNAHQCQQADLRTDPFHCLGCKSEAKIGRFVQHNAVVSHISRTCQLASATCLIEPAGYESVDAQGNATDQQRPDLLIITTSGHILSDVVGYHPTTSSALANQNYDTYRAGIKTRKYANAARHNLCSFVPFVFQTIGGLHQDSVALIDTILRNSQSNVPFNVLRHQALAEMSVAIQRENANMLWRTMSNHFHSN